MKARRLAIAAGIGVVSAAALTLLRGTMVTEPRAYRPHSVLAALYARQEKWADAGREMETAIDLAGLEADRFDSGGRARLTSASATIRSTAQERADGLRR